MVPIVKFAALCFVLSWPLSAATIYLKDGSKLSGDLLQIDQSQVRMRTTEGERSFIRETVVRFDFEASLVKPLATPSIASPVTAAPGLAFSNRIASNDFAQRSMSIGVGYAQLAYPISASYRPAPTYSSPSAPIEVQMQESHLFLQMLGLGAATFHNFWLGYKTTIGAAYAVSATASQIPKGLKIGSAMLTHQQMLGYYFARLRIYTMLGIAADWMYKSDVTEYGSAEVDKLGADGIFAYSGGGVLFRLWRIVLSAEIRVPFWRVSPNRAIDWHGLFSVSYETFG